MIFLIVLCISIMFLVTPFMQENLYEIEPKYFKRIKIKRLSFMFRGIGGKKSICGSAKEYGVIIPMLVIQIMGYLFAFCSIISVLVLHFAIKMELTKIAITICLVLGLELVIAIGTTFVCAIITKHYMHKEKKDKFK